MALQFEPVIDPADRASILELLTGPTETPPAETPPAETPKPEPTPEPEVQPPGVQIDEILRGQEAMADRLESLIKGFSEERGQAAPVTAEGRSEALEELVNESPEARELVNAIVRQQSQIDSLSKRLNDRDSREQLERDVEDQKDRIVGEARELLATHDLKPKDVDTVLKWMSDPANAVLAGTLTFRESAGRSLGYDYVEAQRRSPDATTTPPGAAGGEAKTAKIITDTAPGPGAGSPAGGSPAQGVGGDDLRSACNEVLRTHGHLLGKHK